VARGEHAAEGREHDVEALVLEGQRLGVALGPLHLDACVGRQPPGVLEQLGREVYADHAPARGGSADRRVAGATGDVEHPLTGVEADALDDPVADLPEHVAGDGGVVARRPHLALAAHQLGELYDAHGSPPDLRSRLSPVLLAPGAEPAMAKGRRASVRSPIPWRDLVADEVADRVGRRFATAA
jgi:hypothetical protein